MQTVLQAGAVSPGSSWSVKASSVCPCSDVLSVPCASGGSLITLKTRDRSMIYLRAERSRTTSRGPLHRFRARAEAVEGAGSGGIEANLKVDDLKPVDHPGTAAGLLFEVQEEENKSTETAVERDAAADATLTSAVGDPQNFFKDVDVDAQEVTVDLGRSVEDAVVRLEDKAEDLQEGVVRKAESEGGTTSTRSEGEVTRAQAQQKFVDTAKDGYEVLKWAAEGVVSAGLNARQGLGVAKEVVDKRLKSFGIAADETREVSSQVADVAQKKIGEFHGSASKFGQEFQVNLEEKKAADSLKPESERNPLAKLGQGLQENLTKATSDDGLLGKLSDTLSESLSKVSQASQELASKASKSGEEITDKAKEITEEFTSKIGGTGEDSILKFGEARSTSSPQENGDATGDVAKDYEDERGNELLKGQITGNEGKTNLKFDIDETQVVPSKKQDQSGIGPEE